MKTTEIELAGKCIEYCRKKLFMLRRLKEERFATGYGCWTDVMEKELQKLESIFAEELRNDT